MDLLEFIMELDISYYLEVKNMKPFKVGLDILQLKKVVLHMFFLRLKQKSKLIHMLLCF